MQEELLKQFEAEKNKILAVLMRSNSRKRRASLKRVSVNLKGKTGPVASGAAKVSEPASALETDSGMDELKSKLFALEPHTAAACIVSHLDQCRYVYRERAKAVRIEWLRVYGQTTKAARLLLPISKPEVIDIDSDEENPKPKCQHAPTTHFGTYLAREEYHRLSASEQDDLPYPSDPPVNCPIPVEYLIIHSFDQIEAPSDLNMKKQPWKKIKAYLDLAHPGHQEQTKAKLLEIDEFLG